MKGVHDLDLDLTNRHIRGKKKDWRGGKGRGGKEEQSNGGSLDENQRME